MHCYWGLPLVLMHPLIVELLGMMPAPVVESIETLRKMNIRQFILQCLGFSTMFMSAVMMYKAFSVLTNNPSPATVVLSYRQLSLYIISCIDRACILRSREATF